MIEMRDEFLSEEDLDLRNLSWEELVAYWNLWLEQAQPRTISTKPSTPMAFLSLTPRSWRGRRLRSGRPRNKRRPRRTRAIPTAPMQRSIRPSGKAEGEGFHPLSHLASEYDVAMATATETSLRLDYCSLFVRHSAIQRGRRSLVFLHGLGDSGRAFSEAFERPELAGFNLIVPDLVGFGQSSGALDGDYSFATQAERLWRALDSLGVETVTLVGHSMGGDLATLMAFWDRGERVRSLVSVEGNLTPRDLFISSKAAESADQGRFEEWLPKFAQETVLASWGEKWPSYRRYYESLLFCHQDAFRESARELVRRNGPVPGSLASEMGALYRSLSLPRVFCWGAESLAAETQQLLIAAGIHNKRFDQASHWLMVDQPEELYPFLQEFCERQKAEP